MSDGEHDERQPPIDAPLPGPSSGSGPAPATDPNPPAMRPAPTRGERVMAVVRWGMLLAVTVLAAFTVWTFWGPGASQGSTVRPDRYYCSMHPQIRSPDPGDCPICGMRLVPIPEDRQAGHVRQRSAGDGGTATAAPMPDGVVPVTLSLERRQLIGVVTAPVEARRIDGELRVPAVVETPENALAQVHVRAAGFIERVAVRETGVHVSRGRTLAWMYSPQIYQVQLELLAASRFSAPGSGGVALGDVVAASRRSLVLQGLSEGDVSRILATHTAMRDVPIRAPSSGYVTRFGAVLGTYATPETVLYEIADLSRVWVVASLHEEDVARVGPGMSARFIPSTPDAQPLDATVQLVEPEVVAETRTARARLRVTNTDLRLRPGQYGEIVLSLASAEALVVPRDAVVETGEASYVYVDRGDGELQPRTVRTGALRGSQRVILEGLRAGERVVTRGNFMIDSESRLQAALAASPGGSEPAPPAGHGSHGR